MHRAALIVLVIATAAPCAVRAESQVIHRCIGEHGEMSFSGLPCAGASAPAASSTQPAAARRQPGAIQAAGTRVACPASADALRDVIAEAFARRDANTLAGVMLWEGVGGGAVPARMQELAELTQRPLAGIDVGAEAGADDAQAQPEDTLLVVRTGGLDGGASEHDFRVTTSGGCYWLDW